MGSGPCYPLTFNPCSTLYKIYVKYFDQTLVLNFSPAATTPLAYNLNYIFQFLYNNKIISNKLDIL